MTATVREFCRAYGIDEKSENLVNEIFNALTGGDENRESDRLKDKRAKEQTPIPDSD